MIGGMRRRGLLVLFALPAAVAALAGCGGDEAAPEPEAMAARTPRVDLADLSPDEVVPKGPTDGSGSARITIDASRGKACWDLSLSGVDGPISAHIHRGEPGKAGAVVIPLGSVYAPKGCLRVPRPVLRAVAAAPGGYYVDVHTGRWIDGALRGRLEPG